MLSPSVLVVVALTCYEEWKMFLRNAWENKNNICGPQPKIIPSGTLVCILPGSAFFCWSWLPSTGKLNPGFSKARTIILGFARISFHATDKAFTTIILTSRTLSQLYSPVLLNSLQKGFLKRKVNRLWGNDKVPSVVVLRLLVPSNWQRRETRTARKRYHFELSTQLAQFSSTSVKI